MGSWQLAIDEWSEQNVEMCAARQKNILQQAIACLKPGGFIIYSTCTFEEAENDFQIEYCKLNIEYLETENFGQTKTKFGYQFFPHKIKGEGFYMAVMQKENLEFRNQNLEIRKPNLQSSIFNLQYLNQPDKFTAHLKNDMLFAIPKTMMNDFLFLQWLYIRHSSNQQLVNLF